MLDVRHKTLDPHPGPSARSSSASRGRPAGHQPPTVAPAARDDGLSSLLASAVQRRGGHPVLQRTPESAELLTGLARPEPFTAPGGGAIQQAIVKKVEAGIKAEAEYVERTKKELGMDRWQEWPRDARDHVELFLGGIELTDIPETDEELLHTATLIPLKQDNALDPKSWAYDLTVSSGAADDVVQNTLRTMQAAKQLEYFRKAGIPKPGWKIVIEVHYIRSRGKNRPQFHKDTLGQTLFVNLNYVTDEPMTGAEFMVNPPELEGWDAVISENLPPEFMEDLRKTRTSLPPLTAIEVSNIPAHGVLAFVDEAMHHRTPVLGHRVVSGKVFADYLTARFGAERVAKAEKAYDAYMGSRWPAFSYGAEDRTWFKWIAMARQPKGQFTRPDFIDSGMPPDEIDELVSGADRASRTVSIPRLDQGAPQDIIPDEQERKRRPPLKRTISDLALAKKLPPDVKGDRKFFRTWVRAVKTG